MSPLDGSFEFDPIEGGFSREFTSLSIVYVILLSATTRISAYRTHTIVGVLFSRSISVASCRVAQQSYLLTKTGSEIAPRLG